MLKKLMIIIVLGMSLGGCSLSPKKSGIEIMSYPTAKVFIDGKEAGMTPYRNTTLKPGEVEIKLLARDSVWKRKIELQNNVNTVINWEFGNSNSESGGYLLYMEKTGDDQKSGLMVSGSPDKAAVKIEGELKGFAPMRIDDVGAGDKEVVISFPGYKGINMFVKTVVGYQLVIEAKLAEEKIVKEESILVVEPTIGEVVVTETEVRIRETETGWLRVRQASSSGSREIKKVNPGEEYGLLNEGSGWYQIDLGEGESGWISAKYADKLL